MNNEANKFWTDLSYDDRLKLLQEYNFWRGFCNYLYQYIPNDLKAIIRLKIDCNGLN